MTASSTPRQRHRRICDVHLVLLRDDHVLLTLRKGGYAAGQWQIPSGHLEAQEATPFATMREGAEEIGVHIPEGQLAFVHFMDHRAPGEDPRLGVFYQALTWDGEPYNAEPDKCGGLAWYPLNAVPGNTVPYHAAALTHITAGHVQSTFGFDPALATAART
ncbi:NUDIX hydrolase [Streptomyces sp. NRRL B-1347]|uniref:NUDIX hydrolase n=1 Tax=Streptomyces sp. NRRL B-1347 TaxID=1476877 RepID=UPI0004C5DB82|nr:NUDIX domain-containing protein [Streptomyces sp. NRRL B-1347]